MPARGPMCWCSSSSVESRLPRSQSSSVMPCPVLAWAARPCSSVIVTAGNLAVGFRAVYASPMNDIRFRATRRAGTSTCRVMEYDDGQTWVAAESDGAWWRCPLPLSRVEQILSESSPQERLLDVMRRLVPHYNPHLDAGAKRP